MLDLGLYISFILVSSAIIVIPGPNVLVIVATSLSQGRVQGLQTIAGTLAAMAIQLLVAAKGTALLAEALSEAFILLKWIGAAYLICLGYQRLRAAFASPGHQIPEGSATGSFWRGFVVGITNPKTILFFGAFLPQFTSAALPIGPQIAVLSATFLALALLFDGIYALAAAKVRQLGGNPAVRRWLDGSAGILFLGSGIGLAIARRA